MSSASQKQNHGGTNSSDPFRIDGISDFIDAYPLMRLQPCIGNDVAIEGRLKRDVLYDSVIAELDFFLRIEIPSAYPKAIPVVYEMGGQIPKHVSYHINPGGELCLGTELRLLLFLNRNTNFLCFFNSIVLPHLFSSWYKTNYGGGFYTGELDHGIAGIIQDYGDLLGLSNLESIIQALLVLSLNTRTANKTVCPCGCGQRLGKCNYRNKLNKLRGTVSRSWFKLHRDYLVKFKLANQVARG